MNSVYLQMAHHGSHGNQTRTGAEIYVKLQFNTDFSSFLENNEFNDPVQIVTESGILNCSAVLLAQHSSVLREFIKEDNELFLTDNKHVRECLSILYGGAVKLTEENFQDILKFMVAFDIPGARNQILDWMSGDRWTVDTVGLLFNGSIAATKAFGEELKAVTTSMESLKEEVYKPSRLFIRDHLVKMIRSDSTDTRYQNLDSAMECVISGVSAKRELISLLLHQDLIPGYLPWVKMLMDQSSYNLFLSSLDKPEVSNMMCLCTRVQFEELFDMLEDFENITLQEYKRLSRYKMKINDKITVVQSLKFMKEGGSLYSCWKILDADGMLVLATAFTNKSDQFCVIECLLSWIAANKSSCDIDIVEKILSKVIHHMSASPENISFQTYCTNYVQQFLARLEIPTNQYSSISGIPREQYRLIHLNLDEVIFGEDIVLKFKDGKIDKIIESSHGTVRRDHISNTIFIVKLFHNRIPEVSCDKSIGNYRFYVYAVKSDKVNGEIRVPLYCDPEEAYEMVKECKVYKPNTQGRTTTQNQYTGRNSQNEDAKSDYSLNGIGFEILCGGVPERGASGKRS